MARAIVCGVTEPDFLSAARAAYDTMAVRYAETFRDTLRDLPLERALLAAFAELVRADGGRPVADLGCGPGHVTAHLAGLGLSAFGIDLSPTMIELARADNPGLRFELGSMTALDIADGTLGGVLSRFSVIHTPPDALPQILAEFQRVLAPGGHLLISFPAGDGPDQPTQFYDHTVTRAYRWWPDHFADLLRAAGLAEVARQVRQPEPDDRRQFLEVQLLARKG